MAEVTELQWDGSKGLYSAETDYGLCVIFKERNYWVFVEPPTHNYDARYTTQHKSLREAKGHAQHWLNCKISGTSYIFG